MNTAETNTGKAKQDIGCSSPSAEALKLAVLLSGHQHCHRIVHMAATPSHEVCDGCLGDARTIDDALQLPARTAALLCAQGVVDAWDRQCGRVFESMGSENPRAQSIDVAIDELRDALANISITTNQ